MRARGIDPGETIGWCDIEREAPGVFRYVDSGTWYADKIVRGDWMPKDPIGWDGLFAVAIETPEEMHPNDIAGHIAAAMSRKITAGAAASRIVQTVRNLLDTRALAERIACLLADGCVHIVEPTAAECRRALGVKFGAQRGNGEKLKPDQQLAHIIPLAVRGWPKRSNPHERDAAAAALWALGPGAALYAPVQNVALRQCFSETCSSVTCANPEHWESA